MVEEERFTQISKEEVYFPPNGYGFFKSEVAAVGKKYFAEGKSPNHYVYRLSDNRVVCMVSALKEEACG